MNVALNKITAAETVAAEWGPDAPEWVKTLALFCDQESQAAAARKMKRSASLVNQVLKNRYIGDLTAVKARVDAAFSQVPVCCPILGEITGPKCLGHQKDPYNPGNHMAVRLYVACRKCPNRLNKGNPNAQ